MAGSLDDESDEVVDLARRARGGEFVQVLPELAARVQTARSVPARMAAAVAVADVLVWQDRTIPHAAAIAEAVLTQACADPREALVDMWRPLVHTIVGEQVHHGVAGAAAADSAARAGRGRSGRPRRGGHVGAPLADRDPGAGGADGVAHLLDEAGQAHVRPLPRGVPGRAAGMDGRGGQSAVELAHRLP
jgi:hypothetical protein